MEGVAALAGEHPEPVAARVAAWFSLRAEDRGAAAVVLHTIRDRAARMSNSQELWIGLPFASVFLPVLGGPVG